VHPHAIAAGRHQPTLAEIGEMAGDRRLRNAETVVDVADADLVISEKGKDSQARFVGEGLEEILQLIDGRPYLRGRCAVHIFALTNLS
jgi:hypothetical protein